MEDPEENAAAEKGEGAQDPAGPYAPSFVEMYLENNISTDDIAYKDGRQDPAWAIYCFGGTPGAELLEKRLKQVEEYHSPDAETDARVQGDTAFKVECESPVIPEPSSGGELHDVAADQLYNGCDHDDPDEDQERCDQEPACVDTPFLEPGQRQDEDQRSEAIYDAVRAEQDPSV